jgi:hypothetical protein
MKTNQLRSIFVAAVVMVSLGRGVSAASFTAGYKAGGVTIDGVKSAGEWSDACKYTVTMTRYDGGATHLSTLYFQNDGAHLLVGVDSQWADSADLYWKIYLDGNGDKALTGSASEPHMDVSSDMPAHGAYSFYNQYWYYLYNGDEGGRHTSDPAGSMRASGGSSNVFFEFQVPLSDLTALPGDVVGFTTKHGNNGNWDTDYGSGGGAIQTQPELWDTVYLQTPEPTTLLLVVTGGGLVRSARRRTAAKRG